MTRLALLLLAPLVAAIVWAAFHSHGHSVPSVDGRSYVEMIRGIADHGLPHLENGPSGEYPELQARWNVEHNGKLWGNYAPLFPYLASPFFKFGGLEAVSRLNTALLLFLVAGVFLLARRLTGDPFAGTASAYLSTLSTPLSAAAIDIGPYVLMPALVTWTVYFALRATDTEQHGQSFAHPKFWAAATGFAGGLAIAAHPLSLPMFLAVLLVLLFCPRAGEQTALHPLFRTHLAAWAPSLASLHSGLIALGAAAITLSPVAALNVMRFGTPNVATYGPCVWRSCVETGRINETIGAMLGSAYPVALWLAVSAALLYSGRRRWTTRVMALALSALIFAAWEPMRSYSIAIGKLAVAWIVDCSGMEIPPFSHPRDGLGTVFGSFVIRSTFQQMPLALVGLLAVPLAACHQRKRMLVLALPVAALYLALSLRANISFSIALGFPFMYLRYTLPAMPLMVVLALASARHLPWRSWHILALIAGAALLVLWLARFPDDMAYERRWILLRGTLIVGVGAALALCGARWGKGAWPNAATWWVAAACAMGIAINLAVDLRQATIDKARHDARVDAVAARVPQRFALVGWPREIDTPLALRASRDVEYADLWENEDPLHSERIGSLFDYWTADGRPIFALLPTHTRWEQSPWPGYDLALVDPATNLFSVSKKR
jgi:hypothetical protein